MRKSVGLRCHIVVGAILLNASHMVYPYGIEGGARPRIHIVCPFHKVLFVIPSAVALRPPSHVRPGVRRKGDDYLEAENRPGHLLVTEARDWESGCALDGTDGLR